MDNLRAIKVTYSDGNIIYTSMAAHLTNEEMLNCHDIVREILYKEESLNKLIPNEILVTNDTLSVH